MNIKEIFSRKNKEKESESSSDVIDKEEKSNVPKVTFDRVEFQVAVGQWLGILSSQKVFRNSSFSVYAPLSPEELMEKSHILSRKLREVEEKFGFLLKSAGIDSNETCTLSQYDKDNFSFNCHFNNSGENAKISLRYGCMLDSGPECTIEYLNETRNYDYCSETEDSPARLSLQHYTIKNPENGNSCFRYLSPYSAPFTLENEGYSFSIEAVRPESIEYNIFTDYVFRLNNEEELQQYLLGLTFPIAIDEVYKKICEISLRDVSEYPTLKLVVNKKDDEKKVKTTDMIALVNGQLKKFIRTKDGITVSIDSDGNWSYDSPKLNVSQDDKGKVNFILNAVPNEELAGISSPIDHYNVVSKEVEQVKQLTKKMLNN